MKLLIGLGNPGKKYENTRHNTGFMAIDAVATNFNFSAFGGSTGGGQSKFNAEISEGTIGDEKVILAKPQTFMNESGQTVKAITDYYKITVEDITVIHDDLDILLGEYKIARDRSSAGHKGVQSIIETLGTKNFARIRIGIGTEDKKIPAEAFVLENFTDQEKEVIDGIIEKVTAVIPSLVIGTRNPLDT